jgi:hypothetical protein
MQELLALANEAAAEGPNMNEAVKGGSTRLLPAGYAFARLVEVVELGNHAQEFQGQKKDPAPEIQLGFALYNTADRVYQNDDGTPYIIRPYSFALSQNDKARAFLLFKSLNWKGTATSFGQMLGQAFLAKIVHEAKSKTDATIVSRLDLKGFLPPLDAASGMPYPVPEADISLMRLFLWARPTKAAWDALYVEGQYEGKDGKPAQSKNRVQETIMSALNFAGSPIQQLLMASGIQSLPTAPAGAVLPSALPPGAGYSAPPATPPAAAPVAPALPNVGAAVPAGPSAPVVAATPQNVTAAVAPVAPAVGVGSVPLAPTAPVAPVAAVAPLSPQVPVMPVSPVMPSVIPAG